MRNAWKGLMIGAFTGAGVGLVLDLIDAVALAGVRGAAEVRDKAPEALHWAKDAAERATERIREADSGAGEALKKVPEKVHDLAHRLAESEVADKARDAATKARDVASTAADSLGKAVGAAR